MQNYKPILFLKNTLNVVNTVRDSQEWCISVKSVPFKVFPDMKDIPSRDWNDEHGDDEYIPDKPYYKAYEMDCDFVFIGREGSANGMIKDFLTYLAEGGSFQMYDSYTKIGRQDVRYVSYSEDILYRRDNQQDIVVFSVKLKVNDPITDIYLSL